MRGNEPWQVWRDCERFGWFPIPMRGNEIYISHHTTLRAQFPIPMRGNEVARQRETVTRVQRVSDPHEG